MSAGVWVSVPAWIWECGIGYVDSTACEPTYDCGSSWDEGWDWVLLRCEVDMDELSPTCGLARTPDAWDGTGEMTSCVSASSTACADPSDAARGLCAGSLRGEVCG